MMATTGYRAVIVILYVFAASSESCDETNTIHDENEQIWERIWSTNPTPATERLVDGINDFFNTLRGVVYHLVVLIERSEKLERGEFYLRQRQLVEDIIRYHVVMERSRSTTIITFGKKDKAMMMPGGTNKVTFFQTTWPTVIYEPDEADGNVDIRLAFDLARDAFGTISTSGPRLLLLLSSGEFTDRPSEITLTNLNDTNVKIYVVHCGTTSDETIERLQNLASEPGFCEPFEKWVNASWVNTPYHEVTPDAACKPHGWGYVTNNFYPTCRCAWGYTGDKCNVDEDECDFGMCGADGACWDGIASFVCACLNSTLCGCYCEKTCMEPDGGDGLPGWVVPVIASTCVLLLAVIILIVLVCLVLRHQKSTQHPSNASVAPQQRNIRWFVQQFVVIVTTGCRHDSAGDTDSEVGEGYHTVGAAGADDGTVNTLSEAGGPRVKAFKPRKRSIFSRPPRPPAVKPSPKTVSNRPLPPTPESGNKPSEKEPKTNIEDHKDASKKLGNNEYLKPSSPGNKGKLSQPDYLDVFPGHQMEPKRPVGAMTKSDSALNRKGVSDEVKDDVPSTTDPDDIPYDETEGIYVPRPPADLPKLEDGEAQHISIEQQKGYENVLKCCDMEPWSGYLLQVLYSGRLEYVYISSNDQEQYISSGNNSNFLLTHEEYVLLQSNLTDATEGLCFKFKDRYFVMREAEQTHFVAVHDGAKEVLCVAKNDKYLVVGKRPSVSERSKIICRQNVQYICEYLV